MNKIRKHFADYSIDNRHGFLKLPRKENTDGRKITQLFMKAIDSRLSKFVVLTALASGLALASQAQAQAQAAQAEVTKIKGNATYSAPAGAALPLKVGDKIPPARSSKPARVRMRTCSSATVPGTSACSKIPP